MFYKTLKGLDFRAKKYKKGEFVELDTGLANKLILDGVVDKCDQDEAKAKIEADKKAEIEAKTKADKEAKAKIEADKKAEKQ